MIKTSLTAEDIAAGIAGNCQRCPVALALNRSTGDDETMVYELDWTIYLKVCGRSIRAPYEVSRFAHAFDRQPRTDDGRIDTEHEDYVPMEPFDFELPDQDDPEWQEECRDCGEFCDPSDLNDEGYCKDCLSKSEE